MWENKRKNIKGKAMQTFRGRVKKEKPTVKTEMEMSER